MYWASLRIMLDFKDQTMTWDDPFLIPQIQDLLLKLEGFQHAMSLDLNLGYYHIELIPFSKWLCPIITPWGKYEYQCLPMGLCNSPNILSEHMFELFSDLEYVWAYIDDLLVTSCSPFKKHLEHLEKVLSWLNDMGLNGRTDKTVNLVGLHKPEFVCKQTDKQENDMHVRTLSE